MDREQEERKLKEPLKPTVKPLLTRMKAFKTFYLFLLPAVVAIFIFQYVPMAGVVMAFQDFNIMKGYSQSPFVGLDNFTAFLNDPEFYVALRNTLAMSVLLIVIGFPLPILFALLLNEMKHAMFKRVSQTITYLPHFISWVVISGMAYRLLDHDYGSVNLFLEFLGFNKIDFFNSPNYFWGIIVTSSIWKDLGWNSIIFLAAIAGIDPSVYEAATVDGASRFKKIIYITIPGILPVVGLLFIFQIGSLVGGTSFDAIYNMMNSMVSDKAVTLDYYIYVKGIQQSQPSYAAAVGLVFSVVAFSLVLFANMVSKKLSGYRAF